MREIINCYFEFWEKQFHDEECSDYHGEETNEQQNRNSSHLVV